MRSPPRPCSPAHDRKVIPSLGAAAGRSESPRTRRSPLRVGAGLDGASLGPVHEPERCRAGRRVASISQGAHPDWVDDVMRDTDAFFTPAPTRDYTPSHRRRTARAGGWRSRHADVSKRARHAAPAEQPRLRPLFPRQSAAKAEGRDGAGARWSCSPSGTPTPEGHIGLCKLLAKLGIASLRISLPYHDRRMPPELSRADYIVSSNIVRTIQVCRQAVMDVRRALWWLRDQGYDRLGLLGTSLGSCLAMLTGAHEPLVRAQALNHVSPHFGDVVWRGLSTEHVRHGAGGSRRPGRAARPVASDQPVVATSIAFTRSETLLVYAKYDLTFPVDLSRDAGGGVEAARPADAHRHAAMRALHNGPSAVQVPRRLLPGEFSRAGTCKGSGFWNGSAGFGVQHSTCGCTILPRCIAT